MKVFKKYVHVTDPETGEVTRYEPGDHCAPEHEELVSPKVFFSDDDIAGVQGESEPVAEINYGKLGKEDLIKLCADRDLDTTGTKAALIERLEAHDGALS